MYISNIYRGLCPSAPLPKLGKTTETYPGQCTEHAWGGQLPQGGSLAMSGQSDRYTSAWLVPGRCVVGAWFQFNSEGCRVQGVLGNLVFSLLPSFCFE